MRGVDLPAKIRGIERIIGLEIRHNPELKCFETEDPDLPGRVFMACYARPSQIEVALKGLHSLVYRKRGELVFERQGRKCCFCGGEIREFEIDHISSRGAHGRSDVITNLRCCCTGLGACGLHRKRHGG